MLCYQAVMASSTILIGKDKCGVCRPILVDASGVMKTMPGYKDPVQKSVSELLTSYATATNTNWQPLIAIRKKVTHNSLPNNVAVYVIQFEVYADDELQVRLTRDGTTSN